ncbi:hypothetical protein [Cryobacterium sp. PH29-G1]|uniref:hypothetical protein n=1 Tax=Cryobacterium sp. PH29-G1 TaxID=3046211 RepID=UPI0024B9024B|nr:hypothetical protein [Cryobacterium sp. PH29-G1]MDJ0349784.1 hypothetical protein [Cryobacterium sp. PH29-G1]
MAGSSVHPHVRAVRAALFGLTSLALAVGLGAALSPMATADTSSDTISAAILGGSLSAVVSAPTQMSPVIIDGLSSQASVGRPAEWTITNARGSSAAWSLSVSATDFVSAPGTLDTMSRTVAAENLTITPGIVSARTSEGADAAPTTDPVIVSARPQSLVWTDTLGKGTFTLTPEFSLSVPANAYRSNFSGAIDGSAVNPFVSTLTFTIA